jgi:GNAT superfamily N-acetyltransferase
VKDLLFATATAADAAAIATLRTAVAADLTARYGTGHWSSAVTERGVLHSLKHSRVLLAQHESDIVGVLRLATKKPWVIDPAYFHAVRRPLYLADMAVKPTVQRQGVGRRLLLEGIAAARKWPADAIRLDAYDADAGGGSFYLRCGFREVGRVTYRETPHIYFELLL